MPPRKREATDAKVNNLEKMLTDLVYGDIKLPASIAPGALNKASIKAKSVTASQIKTVTGDITIGPGGKLIWGDDGQNEIDGNDINIKSEDSYIKFISSSVASDYAYLRAWFTGSLKGAGLVVEDGVSLASGQVTARVDPTIGYSSIAMSTTHPSGGGGVVPGSSVSVSSVGNVDVSVLDNTGGIGSKGFIVSGNGGITVGYFYASGKVVIGQSSPVSYPVLTLTPGAMAELQIATNQRFQVKGPTGSILYGVTYNGQWLTGAFDATGGAGAYVTRVPIAYDMNGTPKSGFLRVYAS